MTTQVNFVRFPDQPTLIRSDLVLTLVEAYEDRLGCDFMNAREREACEDEVDAALEALGIVFDDDGNPAMNTGAVS